METAFTGTVAATGYMALPSNYIDFKELYVNASPIQRLIRQKPGWIREKYSDVSAVNIPRYFGREGSNIIFGPTPDSQYTMNGVFYKNRAPLSSNQHSVWTANPDCYLFGALLQATPYLKNDPRIPVWQGMYSNVMKSAQMKSSEEEVSGSDLAMAADFTISRGT